MNHVVIETLIEEFRRRECDELERALLALDALPVPWAWEGCFGIRSDGEVIYVDDTGKAVAMDSFETGASCVIATLVYAARRDPVLACVLPSKPSNAESCAACAGSGRFNKSPESALCGDCIGLGWRVREKNEE
jgi:hypothetical protein